MHEVIPIRRAHFRLRQTIVRIFLIFVKGFEELGAWCTPWGQLYGALFYRKMVAREATIAGLRPGMRVLHIGSGRLPLTAIAMAEQGLYIDAIDNDSRAVAVSQRLIDKLGYAGRINVLCRDGSEVDCEPYDAVLLSLHVIPKRAVINKVLRSLGPNGRLIYRNPHGLFGRLYQKTDPTSITSHHAHVTTKQTLGKETVVIFKEKQREVRALQSVKPVLGLLSNSERMVPGERPLVAMDVGSSGTIVSAEGVPQSTSLGIRPGKTLTVRTIQCFGGPLIVEIDDRLIAVPRPLAAKIRIRSTGGDFGGAERLSATG